MPSPIYTEAQLIARERALSAAYVDHYTPTPDEELIASLRLALARDLGIIDDGQLSAAIAALKEPTPC